MEYRRFGNTIVARIDQGEDVLEKMKRVAMLEDVKLASVSALGTFSSMTVGIYDLEKCLVYFKTALKSNEVELEKLRKHIGLRHYEEDQELLEDVIIENKQAMEMTDIYHNILRSTMSLFGSIIDNNLNQVMKFLAAITIIKLN